MESVLASPSELWRRTLGSLKAFGCVPNDQAALGDGRVALNFMSLVAFGTAPLKTVEAQVAAAKKAGNVARLTYARWSGVFTLINSVFGFDIDTAQREKYLAGQQDAVISLLHRLLLQARASPRWESTVLEADRRNNEMRRNAKAVDEDDEPGWAAAPSEVFWSKPEKKATTQPKKDAKDKSATNRGVGELSVPTVKGVTSPVKKAAPASKQEPPPAVVVKVPPPKTVPPLAVSPVKGKPELSPVRGGKVIKSPPQPPPQPTVGKIDLKKVKAPVNLASPRPKAPTTEARHVASGRTLDDLTKPTVASIGHRSSPENGQPKASTRRSPSRVVDDDPEAAPFDPRDPSLVALVEVRKRIAEQQDRLRSKSSVLSIAEMRRREASQIELNNAAPVNTPPKAAPAPLMPSPLAPIRNAPRLAPGLQSPATPMPPSSSPFKASVTSPPPQTQSVTPPPRVAATTVPKDISAVQEARREKARALLADLSRPKPRPTTDALLTGQVVPPPAAVLLPVVPSSDTARQRPQSPASTTVHRKPDVAVDPKDDAPLSSRALLLANASPVPGEGMPSSPSSLRGTARRPDASPLTLQSSASQQQPSSGEKPSKRKKWRREFVSVDSSMQNPTEAEHETTSPLSPVAAPSMSFGRSLAVVLMYCRSTVSRLIVQHQQKRWPTAQTLQHWYRYRRELTVWRQSPAAAQDADDEKDAAGMGACSRCAAVLMFLRRYVALRHSVKLRDLRRYRQLMCKAPTSAAGGESNTMATSGKQSSCAAALARMVKETQDCNLYRNDVVALDKLKRVQACLRSRGTWPALVEAHQTAVSCIRVTALQAALRRILSLIIVDRRLEASKLILEVRFAANRKAYLGLIRLQAASRCLLAIRRRLRSKKQQSPEVTPRVVAVPVCVERCQSLVEMLQRRWISSRDKVNLATVQRYCHWCCDDSASRELSGTTRSTLPGNRCAVKLFHWYASQMRRRNLHVLRAVAVFAALRVRCKRRTGVQETWARQPLLHAALLRQMEWATDCAVGFDANTDVHARCVPFRESIARRCAAIPIVDIATHVLVMIKAVRCTHEPMVCRECWRYFSADDADPHEAAPVSGAQRLLDALRRQRMLHTSGTVAAALRFTKKVSTAVKRRQRLVDREGDRRAMALVSNACCVRDKSTMLTLKRAFHVDDVLRDTVERVPPSSSEWAAINPRLGKYASCLCASCASLVPMLHKYCREFIATLRFVQDRSRWVWLRRHRGGLNAVGGAASITLTPSSHHFELQCRRCQPIHDQLATRLARRPNLHPQRIRAYASVLCTRGCRAGLLGRIEVLEERHQAASVIQRAFRSHRLRVTFNADKRARDQNAAPSSSGLPRSSTGITNQIAAALTRGRCQRCGPVLDALRARVLAGKAVSESGAAQYRSACCPRCLATCEALLRPPELPVTDDDDGYHEPSDANAAEQR